jgi:hypothetical protein
LKPPTSEIVKNKKETLPQRTCGREPRVANVSSIFKDRRSKISPPPFYHDSRRWKYVLLMRLEGNTGFLKGGYASVSLGLDAGNTGSSPPAVPERRGGGSSSGAGSFGAITLDNCRLTMSSNGSRNRGIFTLAR